MALGEQINSWIESIKIFWSEFDFKAWTQKVGGTSGEAVETAVYFGLSFALGFFFRRYGKQLLISLVVSILVIKGLEYFNFLTLDWQAIKAALGMMPPAEGAAPSPNVIVTSFEWIKNNIALSIASAVGFLIGYKVG